MFVLFTANNKKLADSLAREFIVDSLNSGDRQKLLTKENLDFLYYFIRDVKVSDSIFYYCYTYPELVNLNAPSKEYAQTLVDGVVYVQEIQRLVNNQNDSGKEINWDSIESILVREYPKANVPNLIADYKLVVYKNKSDWLNYSNALIQRVNKFGAFGLGGSENIDLNLNNHAWDLFNHSNDKDVLNVALAWSDSAISILKRALNQIELANFMDTKANILYKLGHCAEAIKLETEVVKREPDSIEFKDNLARMRKGLPTWKY